MPKKKYSNELKLKIVLFVLDRKNSIREAENHFKIGHGDITKWVSVYQKHGIEGLTNVNWTYPGEFKINVIEYIQATGCSLRTAAAHFNIASYGTIRKWERIFIEEGKEALFMERRGSKTCMAKKKQTKSEISEDLIQELQRLRMENEYLKKLNALVQKREKSKNKTK